MKSKLSALLLAGLGALFLSFQAPAVEASFCNAPCGDPPLTNDGTHIIRPPNNDGGVVIPRPDPVPEPPAREPEPVPPTSTPEPPQPPEPGSYTEAITYYHNDHLGSPIAATDQSGNLLWQRQYAPYGEELNQPAGEEGSAHGFTGHQSDKETGLVYMQARYYDPSIGRFLAMDPVGFDESNPQSFNRYAYANNNPYLFVDPDGRVALVFHANRKGLSANQALMVSGMGNTAIEVGQAAEAILGIPTGFIHGGKSALYSSAKYGFTKAAGKSLNPNSIRFSQSSVNGTADLVASMKKSGWKGSPIDVVKMWDGSLTTLDNTRVLAASRAGVNVRANIRNASDALPSNYVERFTTKKGVPSTWGEAAQLRIGKQSAGWRKGKSNGSMVTRSDN